MNLFKILPAGVALVLVLSFLLRSPADVPNDSLFVPSASAQEMVSNAVQAIQGLSDDEIQALNERLGVLDCGDLLTQAREASDLHLLDSSEYFFDISEDGDTFNINFGGEHGAANELTFISHDSSYSGGDQIRTWTFLGFTGQNGDYVTMGFPQEGVYVPELVLIYMPSVDGAVDQGETTFETGKVEDGIGSGQN